MRTPPTTIDFLSPLSVVPGFGEQRVSALRASGLETVGDLLHNLPRRYIDRSSLIPFRDLAQHVDEECAVAGRVVRTRVERGPRPRFRAQLDDGTGTVEAVWFQGAQYLRSSLRTGERVLLTGKVTRYGTLQMVHPQVEPMGEDRALPEVVFLPHYRVTLAMRDAGIGQKSLQKAIRWLLANVKHYPRVLPRPIEERTGFPPLEECLKALHLPSDLASLDVCRRRLTYEHLYTIAIMLRSSRRAFAADGRAMQPGDLLDRFTATLPYSLTEGQRRAIDILLADSLSERRMHRLLHGDVGAGKTVVAFCVCLPALAGGYQVAWLAPTEVLAHQTWERIREWLRPMGLEAALLTGSAADKHALRAGLGDGSVRFVVGTHALLQPTVAFAKLGMIVVDEQHRFGVAQRVAIERKGPSADFLLMSATPIPQTLAQTLYGDLDVVAIKGLPSGRTPVETHVVSEAKRAGMEQFVRERIERDSAQVYYVLPRIERADDEETDLADLQSTYERLTKGAFAGIPAAFIHGRMQSDDKARAAAAFAHGDARLLFATTVVEVGMDNRGATVVVVENAERFGLSQLHQLRGRVGRGTARSYCFLLSPGAVDSPELRDRLESFCRNHDGFSLADLDLKLRGPGQALGAAQSGWDDESMRAVMDNVGLFREVQLQVAALAPDRRDTPTQT